MYFANKTHNEYGTMNPEHMLQVSLVRAHKPRIVWLPSFKGRAAQRRILRVLRGP